ncbi:hypothetical protein CU103_15900 [Phyllobacterium sophorae]|uniref:Uncharacterized protein n=1 Tax=Phyllobacterium sophorae TaxID=1520277 RepID=A0A2P7B999_9HYPH|nr:hypothetical protein CU103_15900 [Phyllobacterium sophorae]
MDSTKSLSFGHKWWLYGHSIMDVGGKATSAPLLTRLDHSDRSRTSRSIIFAELVDIAYSIWRERVLTSQIRTAAIRQMRPGKVKMESV